MTRSERIEAAALALVAEAERTLGVWPGASRSHPFLWAAMDRLQAAIAPEEKPACSGTRHSMFYPYDPKPCDCAGRKP